MNFHLDEILEILWHFDLQKRNLCDVDHLSISYPQCIRSIEGYKQKLENSEKYPGIKEFRGKVQFPIKMIKDLYLKTIGEIETRVRNFLTKYPDSVIMLVGGFSESNLIYESLKYSFKDNQILRPPESGLSISKGAVMYGCQQISAHADSRKKHPAPLCYSV